MSTSSEETPRFLTIKGQTIAMHGVKRIEQLGPKMSLLRNPEFHLIHVRKDDGQRCSMTIVTPGRDRLTRKQVVEQGYYTISHLWGPEEEWKLWTDHDIIGIDGEEVEVNIRPEKKDGLLRLLSTVQGFWWVDVFCAQSKTPPSIMGDVYRFCNRCYSLVDFPSEEFSCIEAISMQLESVESIKDLAEPCRNRINGRMVSENQSWHEPLDDILGGWYDGDPTDIRALADFLSCQWFARVWTLQEYLLPWDLAFISEDNPENHCVDRSIITGITEILFEVASEALGSLMPGNVRDSAEFLFFMSRAQYDDAAATPGAARCYFDMARFADVNFYLIYNGIFDANFDVFDKSIDVLVDLDFDFDDKSDLVGFLKLRDMPDRRHGILLLCSLQVFARLPRRSMYTRDYIYGLLGLLEMNIPVANDDEEIWALFIKITQKTLPLLKIPEKSPLAGAKDMQDVYGPVMESIRAFLWKFDKVSNVSP